MLTEREGALKYFNRSDVSGVRGPVPHPQLPRALPGDTLPLPPLSWGPSARCWSQPFPLVWVALEALLGPRGTGLAPCRQVRGTLGSVWRGWLALPKGTGASAAPGQGEGRGQAGRVGSRKGAPGLGWGGPDGPPSHLLTRRGSLR